MVGMALHSVNSLQLRIRTEALTLDFERGITKSLGAHRRIIVSSSSHLGTSKHCVVAFPRRQLWKDANLTCNAAAAAAAAASSSSSSSENFTFLERIDVQFVCAAVATVLLSSANKVMYKMALVPLRAYPLFLAQFNTIAYVLAYSSILLVRYRAGIVTKEMLAIPKGKFVMIGALESLGLAMGMASAALLPGAIIPVLAQVFLVWQLVLSSTILGKRYSMAQFGGCLLVIAGVIVVVASGSGGVAAGTLQQSGYLRPLVMITSTFFFAAASILKEVIFKESAQQLKGGNLDLFVVNTFGSLFQTLFVSMILPMAFTLRGVPFHQIPHVLKDGYACFLNLGGKVQQLKDGYACFLNLGAAAVRHGEHGVQHLLPQLAQAPLRHRVVLVCHPVHSSVHLGLHSSLASPGRRTLSTARFLPRCRHFGCRPWYLQLVKTAEGKQAQGIMKCLIEMDPAPLVR